MVACMKRPKAAAGNGISRCALMGCAGALVLAVLVVPYRAGFAQPTGETSWGGAPLGGGSPDGQLARAAGDPAPAGALPRDVSPLAQQAVAAGDPPIQAVAHQATEGTDALPGAAGTQGAPAGVLATRIGYLRWVERRPVISLLDQPPQDDGLAGARLGLDDDNTTGRFMNQSFELVDVPVRASDDAVAELDKLTAQGIRLVMTDVPGPLVLRLAVAAKGSGVSVFNVAAPDDDLRGVDCQDNLINVAPSRAMLADAVGQYLVWKKWTRWLLVVGSHPDDVLLGDACRRTAKRYGAKIVEERTYKDTDGSRETDSGVVQTQQQLPVFTQGVPAYDVAVAADENSVFAEYLPYRTWDPRPVAGSAGMVPTSWDPSSESFGGTQLQNRFGRNFHRGMRASDLQAWTAVRMVGEAVSHVASADAAKVMAYMKGPEFGVAAYKGQKLTLRDWDLQLRQPLLLADGRTIVSISPQPGFLHQTTELDTLGYDRPETTCKLK